MSQYFILILIILFPCMSFAASFDCARATTKMEKLICHDPQLSKVDEELTAAYSLALKEAPNPEAIKQQQREWLTDAQYCNDHDCLLGAMWSRTAQLVHPENGIWTGTLGDQSVMACFFHFDQPNYENDSGYFYLRQSQRITLTPRPGKTTIWYEGDPQSQAGIWTMRQRHGDTLLGQWSDTGGNRLLPIRLTRFKTLSMGDVNSAPIGCDAESVPLFNATINARLQKDKITAGQAVNFEGMRYRKLDALPEISTLELMDKGEINALLNKRLKNELTVGLAEHYACNGSTDEKQGRYYSANIELAFWNTRWIIFVRRTGGDCGGAHPFSESNYSTWNSTTGQEVNLWAWIEQDHGKRIPRFDHYYGHYVAPNQLNKLVIEEMVKPWGKDPGHQCVGFLKENANCQLSLGKKGLVFHTSFAHVIQSCDSDAEISYHALLPYLTKEGKDAVKLLLSGTGGSLKRVGG